MPTMLTGAGQRKCLEMNNLYMRATRRFFQLLLLLAVCVFVPAGTLEYWQGWLFSAVFAACSLADALPRRQRPPAARGACADWADC
jgi:hypothetical protein